MISTGGTSNLRKLEDNKAKYGLIGATLPEQKHYLERVSASSC